MEGWVDEPVVDPAVPEADRQKIIRMPVLLDGFPEPSSRTRLFFAVDGAVAGVIGAFLVGVAVQSDSQVAAILSIFSFVIAALFASHARPGPAARMQRLYGDCCIFPADLDDNALGLIRRARKAIESVSTSRVNRLGLLDDIANDVVLPEKLWEIARLLRTQVALRAEQEEAMSEMVTPELVAVITPQREALDRSMISVTKQVVELEDYASRVQEADAALRAHELLKSNDKYRDLLARTNDAQGLQSLTEHVDMLESTLAENLRDAINAGQTLAVPGGAAAV
ncbi:hypothetical protein AB0G15_38955 [Streptosporangium sp. NPDC023825]|uniref:hypothetical protein n=1 Tax=Streptosporangium sp. NPDC023825 TaxID=3154909 RepID=UPI00342B7384